jgi:hypothetical protein
MHGILVLSLASALGNYRPDVVRRINTLRVYTSVVDTVTAGNAQLRDFSDSALAAAQ